MAAKKPNPKRMSEERFVRDLSENYRAGVRYCFILGSGASFCSGIPTGLDLMKQWRSELLSFEKQTAGYIRESAQAAGVKLDDKEYHRLFVSPDYQPQSEDYFTFFDIRYEGKAAVAYRFLQEKMGKAKPSFGYYALSEFLVKTENKLVITTNFDTLMEDTLFFSQLQHPLVLGHESLAAYIGQTENEGRPVVAKVHRDLFYKPLNTKKEVQKLADQWEAPLRDALHKYVPIVIGYGGGDKTLMSLLDKLHLRGIYWCAMRGGVPDRIAKLVETQNGYLVEIRGFDQLLLKLVNDFTGDASWQYIHPTANIRNSADDRIRLYDESLNSLIEGQKPAASTVEQKLTESQTGRKTGSQQAERDIEKEKEEHKETLEDLNRLENAQPESTRSTVRQLRLDAQKQLEAGRLEEALQTCDQAIKHATEDANLYELKSDILFAQGEKEAAKTQTEKAIAYGEKSGYISHVVRIWMLNNQKRYSEAIMHCSKAIELKPDAAQVYFYRGIVYVNLGQKEAALADYSKAIELKPDYAEVYYNRGLVHHTMGQKEAALADYSKAIELKPDDAEAYNNRGNVYDDLGQKEAALADYSKAIELKPDYAEAYNNRGFLFAENGGYEQAFADLQRSLQLKPDNPFILHSLGFAYMKRDQEGDDAMALEAFTKALQIDSTLAEVYRDRAKLYRKLGRDAEARADEEKASALEQDTG